MYEKHLYCRNTRRLDRCREDGEDYRIDESNENGTIPAGYTSANDNDTDSLWDDDVDECPISASGYKLDARNRSYRFSSSSSSSSSSSDDDSSEKHPKHSHADDRERQYNDENTDLAASEKDASSSKSSSSSSSSSSFSYSSSLTNVTTHSEDVSSIISVESVAEMIQDLALQAVIEPLSRDPDPSVPEINASVDVIDFKRKLSLHHLTQARSLTSILKVAAFCYELLAPCRVEETVEESETNGNVGKADKGAPRGTNKGAHRQRKIRSVPQTRRRTTTTREVYYFYVTYFRDQRECDKAIWDLVCILGLPSRQSLGLVASPKGWFCGSIDVYNVYTGELKFNGRELDAHGMAITPSTYDSSNYQYHTGDITGNDNETCGSDDTELLFSNSNSNSSSNINSNHIRIESDAKCILVIEKEGVYTRLSEDKFFLRYFPCILVTGKGFPDVATRRWVKKMQKALNIPVYGLCDCNPFGVSVLDSYRHEQGVRLCRKSKNDGKKRITKRQNLYDSENCNGSLDELHWIGLRPSQVETMNLPPQVFQELTTNDQKRLDSLLAPRSKHSGSFAERGGRDKAARIRELKAMRNYKVELEALHWKGADYLCEFVHQAIRSEHERCKPPTSISISTRPTEQRDGMLGTGTRCEPRPSSSQI